MGQEDAVLEQWCCKAGRVEGKWSRAFDGEAWEQSGLSKQSVHALAEETGRRYSLAEVPRPCLTALLEQQCRLQAQH